VPAVINQTRAGFPGWHFHPDVWVFVLLLAGGYLLAVRRHGGVGPTGPTGRTGPTSRRQVAWFLAGVATIWLGSDWPVHDVAEGYLYSAHMVQHLLVTLVAAPMLLMGTPAWMAERLLSPRWLFIAVRGLGRPIVNLLQANLVLVLSHWPLVVEATLRHHPLHFGAHAALLSSALIMWLPLLSPHPAIPRLGPLMQMLYLFLQTIIPTIPASFLTLGRSLLYPIYGEFPRLWGANALTDQQVAGLIMKVGAGFYLWAIIIVIFFRWYEREEKKPRDVLLWEDVERELNQPSGTPRLQ